jgi:hypothetical protein
VEGRAAEQREHSIMHAAIAGDERTVMQRAPSVRRRRHTPCLFDDHLQRGDIPRRHVEIDRYLTMPFRHTQMLQKVAAFAIRARGLQESI